MTMIIAKRPMIIAKRPNPRNPNPLWMPEPVGIVRLLELASEACIRTSEAELQGLHEAK